MCRCTPEIKTPFCGKPGCEWPPQKPRPTASSQCPHSDLDINVHHQAFVDSSIHYLEIKARCRTCDKPMLFRGAPFGFSPQQPTMAVDGSEIRLPFLAEDEELTGNTITFTGRRVV
jgi:hypothetical protein